MSGGTELGGGFMTSGLVLYHGIEISLVYGKWHCLFQIRLVRQRSDAKISYMPSV